MGHPTIKILIQKRKMKYFHEYERLEKLKEQHEVDIDIINDKNKKSRDYVILHITSTQLDNIMNCLDEILEYTKTDDLFCLGFLLPVIDGGFMDEFEVNDCSVRRIPANGYFKELECIEISGEKKNMISFGIRCVVQLLVYLS